MKRFACFILALGVAACGTPQTPPDPRLLDRPLDRLMVAPDPQLPIPPPACEGDPNCRAAEYYAPHRAQCGGYRDGLIGLQLYVSSVHGATAGDWPVKVTR